MKKLQSRAPIVRLGKFPSELQRRSSLFLDRPVPAELRAGYVPDSLAEVVISHCARNEALDPDLLEIAEMAERDYDDAIAHARSEELKTYYVESRTLLELIRAASR